jgi:tetratricopeptide (TPR) repeat protein
LNEQLAYSLGDLAFAFQFAGQLDAALATRREADRLWRELDNKPMLTDNLGGMSQIYLMRADFERVLQTADEAAAVSQAIGNVWGWAYALGFIGIASQQRGELGRAVVALRETIRLAEQVGAVGPLVATRTVLASVYFFLGAFELALEQARAVAERAESQLKEWLPWPLGMLARIHLQLGQVGEAERKLDAFGGISTSDLFAQVWPIGAVQASLARVELAIVREEYTRALALIQEVLAEMSAHRLRALLPDVLQLQARVLLAQGREEDAFEILTQARDEAQAVNAPLSLWTVLFDLARIKERRGDEAQAQTLRAQAREIVREIAEKAPDELRAPFLNRPDIRAVVA